MMNAFRCYTREELQEFMLGKLPVPKTEEITDHLDQCSTCEDTVIGLEKASDTLVNLLAGSDADSSPATYQKNPDYDRAATAAQQVINSWVAHTDSSPQRSVDQQTIGDYEIIQTLARGGMGSVFRARHTRLEKEVAIKILPERKMQSPDAIARFSREMKIIGQMSHPTMVAATDAGAADGIHYLVMELVDGFDLGKLVGRCGPLAVADACELIRQSAWGIQYAHEQDVVHRDVKPSNLMLASDSKVKVLDLGLATLGGLTGTVDELTTVGQLMGTLDYMAPEQCGSSQPVGPPCDVYGLGATLYKLIAGVAPYSSPENDTPLKKLRAMATCEPTPIDERVTGLPAELVSIVNRCLADLPTDRFDSAADLATALEQLCANHDLPGLLQRANSVASQSNGSVPLLHNPRSAQKQLNSGTDSKAKPAIAAAGSSRRWISTAIGLASAGFAILAGVLIYLNTTAGQLIIESEVEDVRVTVMKNDLPTKDVQVEQGTGSTKLWAGEYQIVIESDSDQLEIENDKFVLRRGETVVAKITKKAHGNSGRALSLDSDTAVPAKRPALHANGIQRQLGQVPDNVEGEPTYDSKGIEYWIDLHSSSKKRQPQRSGALKVIQQLAPHLSEDRKKEIVERRLDRYKHEVSPSFHTAMAAGLAPLCDSEELFDKLFDHVSSRTDPNVLGSGSPERFQVKMLEELKSGDPERQARSIRWARQNIGRRSSSQLSRGRRSEEGLLKQQLIPEWKDALLKRIDNVDQQQRIMTVLADRFGEDPEVIEAIYKCVMSAEYSSGHSDWIYYLLQAKPKDEVIPVQATKLLKEGLIEPSYFVHLAFPYGVDGPGDRRLIDQLNQVLLDSSWGLSSETIGTQISGQSGGLNVDYALVGGAAVGDAGQGLEALFGSNRRMRRALVEEIQAVCVRYVASEQSEDTKTRIAEVVDSLLPAIHKQIEFKFVDPQKTKAAEQATKELHEAANKAIASLTGVDAKELCKGYDITHWAKAFASAKSESAKLEAIQNVYQLRGSKNVPDDFVLLIVQGVKGLSFDHVNFSNRQSVQSLAIDLFRGHHPSGARLTKVAMLFIESLNQLTDKDAMFAFWVLRDLSNYSGRESQEVFEYAKLYQGADNYLLRSRALAILFKHGTFLGGRRSSKKVSSLEKIFDSVLTDESLSNRQKLRIHASYTIPNSLYPKRNGEFRAVANKWFKLVSQIEDPRELAMVFYADHFGPPMVEIALDLIAKNPDFLHQVHQPLKLDCWATPEQEERFSTKSNSTLFDLCLVEIVRSENGELNFQDKDQADRVLVNLESIKTSATDVQRKRIDQILKKIKLQLEAATATD